MRAGRKSRSTSYKVALPKRHRTEDLDCLVTAWCVIAVVGMRAISRSCATCVARGPNQVTPEGALRRCAVRICEFGELSEDESLFQSGIEGFLVLRIELEL